MEVEACDLGLGTMLSQQKDGKLHPCAYFFRCLTPAEQNYDVGNHEHLCIKPALEEWRHWLEGKVLLFIV